MTVSTVTFKRNAMYLAKITALPTKLADFINVKQIPKLTISYVNDSFGYDINGNAYQKDLPRTTPTVLTLELINLSVSALEVNTLLDYMRSVQKIFIVDGTSYQYEYDDTAKSETIYLKPEKDYLGNYSNAYYCFYTGYIADISGDHTSPTKSAAGCVITIALDYVYYLNNSAECANLYDYVMGIK
jgi:hypothetical protein